MPLEASFPHLLLVTELWEASGKALERHVEDAIFPRSLFAVRSSKIRRRFVNSTATRSVFSPAFESFF